MNLDEAILNIQNAALEVIGTNCINKEISYQQAWSIFLRSEQLRKETGGRPVITREDKLKQIDICWKKRYKTYRR